MTTPLNHKDTTKFFKVHNYFGGKEENFVFFN